MKIDVVFSPARVAAADVQGKTVALIDVLRATSTIAVALHNGARAVVPAGSSEEALRIAANLEKDATVLAGERRAQRIPGFALGNSPSEFTRDAVGGKTVVLSTTNGTAAIAQLQGAGEIVVTAAVNFAASRERCREALEKSGELFSVCAGNEQQFALEDAFAAGRLVKVLLPQGGLKETRVNDGVLAALEIARHFGDRWLKAFRASSHGQELQDLGYREDVKLCAQEDTHPVLALHADRRITAHRPANEG